MPNGGSGEDPWILTPAERDHVAGEVGGEIEPMIERLEARCRELAIEPPPADRMDRIARTALRAHEDRFHASVYERLSLATRERLDALLRPEKSGSDDVAPNDTLGSAPAVLLKLRGSPGFHGLSYEYIASVLPQVDPQATTGRTVVLHLGNGASMCAIHNGNSVASGG